MDPETVVKLLRLAVDSRTPDGEAQAAFCAIRRSGCEWSAISEALIKRSLEDYNQQLAMVNSPEHVAMQKKKATEEFKDSTLWFGKYKGDRISSVAKLNIGYIHWILLNFDRLKPDVRRNLELATIIWG